LAASFVSLHGFVMEQRELWEKFFSPDVERLDERPGSKAIASAHIEVDLLRALCVAREVAGLQDPTELSERFASFLDTEDVQRKVWVPLSHLELEEENYDLGDFGLLKRLDPPKHLPIPVEMLDSFANRPKCALEFTINTCHFFGAQFFPLTDAIRSRLTILRIVAHPLISFCHFNVQSISPWEPPLEDTAFQGVFYIGTRKDLPSYVFTRATAGAVGPLKGVVASHTWNQISPFTLAAKRLDAAVFKLECNSPEVILDLSIGLESLFVERSSRQESTHKIATRTSRYLEHSLDDRKNCYKQIKSLYGMRSALAHGHEWKIEPNNIPDLIVGLSVLARALRRMAEESSTELDLLSLDLS
jgi:hypothetical protein